VLGILKDKDTAFLVQTLERFLKLLSHSTRFYPSINKKDSLIASQFVTRKTAVELELIKCQKSVFVGLKEDVMAEYDYLKSNYERKNFCVAQDFIHVYKHWSFDSYGNSKVPFYFHQLVASGIMEELKVLAKHKTQCQRAKGTKFLKKHLDLVDWIPTAINTSLQTVFILYGFLVTTCVLSIAAERLNTRHIISCASKVYVQVKSTLRTQVSTFYNNFVMTMIMHPLKNCWKTIYSKATKYYEANSFFGFVSKNTMLLFRRVKRSIEHR